MPHTLLAVTTVVAQCSRTHLLYASALVSIIKKSRALLCYYGCSHPADSKCSEEGQHGLCMRESQHNGGRVGAVAARQPTVDVLQEVGDKGLCHLPVDG